MIIYIGDKMIQGTPEEIHQLLQMMEPTFVSTGVNNPFDQATTTTPHWIVDPFAQETR